MSSCAVQNALQRNSSRTPQKKIDAAKNKNPFHPKYPVSIKKSSPTKSFSKAKMIKTGPLNHRKKRKNYWKKRWRNSLKSENFHSSQNTQCSSVPNNFNSCIWFWKNYELAQQWQKAHTTNILNAHTAVGLFQKSVLKPFSKPFQRNVSRTNSHGKRKNNRKSNPVAGLNFSGSFSSLESDLTHQDSGEDFDQVCENEEDYEFEFKVDENMKVFLEQSMRHKQEMQRLREAEDEANVDTRMFEAPQESVMDERKRTMEFQYGAAAPKILSMEMALQMSYDRHFDQKQPPLWPNLPLKL